MAQVWVDQPYSLSHKFADNAYAPFQFQWYYITFSGEKQAMAEIRYRKARSYSTVYEIMNPSASSTWTTISVGRHVTDTNIEHIDIPIGTLSEGIWFFEVRFKNVGAEGGDWSGWATHKMEITPWELRDYTMGTTQSLVKGPDFPNEGLYGMKVQVMSEAGILSADSAEVTFDVWETNKYLNSGGVVGAIPEAYHNGTAVLRVKRT